MGLQRSLTPTGKNPISVGGEQNQNEKKDRKYFQT
jgi:hypothetical protein